VIIATGNAIAIGAALAIAIMLGGHISGGHFNSAVTVMMAAAGKIPMSDVVPYILAQIAGGLVALELHKRIKF
jgi:aquaporin Z